MKTALFWILGFLAVGGGSAFVYSKATGRNILKRNACINDLKFVDREEILSAKEDRDVIKLEAIKVALEEDGFNCAAEEVENYIIQINNNILSESKAAKCPNKDQLRILLKDIVDQKITKSQAEKVLDKLKSDDCDDADIVEEKIKSSYKIESITSKAVKTILEAKAESDLKAEKAKYAESMDWYRQKQAESDWPGIMSLGNEVGLRVKAQAVALGLKKNGSEYIAYSDEDGKNYVAVKLERQINGYIPPSPSELRSWAKDLKDNYGDVYQDAVNELNLIEYSIRIGNLPDPS